MNTVNNLVQKDKNAAWEAIPADDRRRTLTKLMHAAEETAALVSQNFKKPVEVEVSASNLGMQTTSMNDIACAVFSFYNRLLILEQTLRDSHWMILSCVLFHEMMSLWAISGVLKFFSIRTHFLESQAA